MQVIIPSSGASKHEVTAAIESRGEVVAGLVSQARRFCFLFAAPPSPVSTHFSVYILLSRELLRGRRISQDYVVK